MGMNGDGESGSIVPSVCLDDDIYIYIYRERERERDMVNGIRKSTSVVAQSDGAVEYTDCTSAEG